MRQDWLPDWLDESSYLKIANNSELAWEWLRRDIDYQHDYHQWKKLGNHYADELVPSCQIHINGHGEKAIVFHESIMQISAQVSQEASTRPIKYITVLGFLLRKYGFDELPDLPNPALKVNEQWVLFKDSGVSYLENEDDSDNCLLNIRYKDQIAIVFRTDLPLSGQIKKITKALKHKFVSSNKRNRRDKYLAYLRVFDAVTVGVEKHVIASVIFPGVPNDHASGYLGDKNVGNYYNAGKKLIKDYLSLVYLS